MPNTGWIHALLSSKIADYVKSARYAVDYMPWIGSQLDENMNHATRHFLNSTKYDYMLRLDSDQPPRKNPLDLIELELDVVGGPMHTFAFEP